ncbi:MAG: hypothetical protein CMD14_04035 [Flavobacteriales bacterium]|nr:hypothetical protein [Flavobacteriales bacterium]|tara:strand:- start:12193 stop:13566 length:1374 start_codon:yes stop_codon:yes gene_type:complete
MKGGEIVRYTGGAAAEDDDGCGGWAATIRGKTNKIAVLILLASPALAEAAHTWVRNSEYGAGYDRTIDAMYQIFVILDNLAHDLVGRQDTCTNLVDVGMGMFGLKNCQSGETRMRGIVGSIINYIQEYLGNDAATAWLARGLVTGALLTSMRNYISRLLTKIICTIYYFGNRGTIETWRIIKIVLSTTTQFVIDVGQSSGKMALAFGGGLVQYLTTLPSQLRNDVPRDMDVVDENIDDVIVAHEDVDNVIEAVNNLENVEDDEDDALLDEYERSDEAEEDFQNVDETVDMMIEYLDYALRETENSDGEEYLEHQMIREGILRHSGRYDENQEVEDQTASQQIFDYYDEEMDYDSPLQRARTHGGIIKKKDIPFIKNLNKSIQIIKKKYKLKKLKKLKKPKKPKKSKKIMKAKKGTKKSNRAGFINRYTRSNKKIPFRPFIIKNLKTRKHKKKTRKCT